MFIDFIHFLKSLINTNDKKQLLSNFTSLSILQGMTYILPLITTPYLVRVLGIERFGLVMFAKAFIAYFVIFVDYGFTLSATKEVSVNRNNPKKLTEIYSSVMLIKIILLSLSFIVMALIVLNVEKFNAYWELYFLSFGFVIGETLFPVWYFQGIEKMNYITIVNVVAKLFFAMLIFVVVQDEKDYLMVPLLNSTGMIIAGFLSLWIIHKKISQNFSFQKPKILLKYLKDSGQYFLSRISVSLYTTSNAFILGLATNSVLVGYYSIAETLFKAIDRLYTPLNNTLYPYMAKEKNISLYKKVFIITSVFNTFLCLFLFFFSDTVLVILFGNDGLGANTIFHIFLLTSIILIPSVLTGYSFLGALGYVNYVNNSVIIGSFFHLISLGYLFFMGEITVFTVAFLTFTTQIVVFSVRLFGVRRFYQYKKGVL